MLKTMPYTDAAMLKAVRNKGTSGWELFFRQYDPLIESIARWPKWNFSQDEQEDVCQNIRMHLQSAVPSFKERSSLSWFVKRIAMNHCVNEIRRQQRWRSLMTSTVQQTQDGSWSELEFASPEQCTPGEEAERNERCESLISALQHMNTTCRNSIEMFYLHNRTYSEMAQTLGISTNTVGSRLAKCLDKLHKTLRHNRSFERTVA